MHCPLCHHAPGERFFQDKHRAYFHCVRCDLRFADPERFLSEKAEKQVYEQHENSPLDAGYRRFLSRATEPLLTKLASGAEGLDFGSGPGPTLSVMMAEQGFQMWDYDPYFCPDVARLERQYDFVTCTEVAEHFNRPAKEWKTLLSLVKPGGWLVIMTKLAQSHDAFSGWHYKNDPTHVSFYSQRTMQWIAEQWQCELAFYGADVILFQVRSN